MNELESTISQIIEENFIPNEWNEKIDNEIDLKLSIINFLDESAPRLYDAPDFSFDKKGLSILLSYLF
jgi:hypothetical protein